VTGLEKTYVPRDALTRANNEAAQRRHALTAWETAAPARRRGSADADCRFRLRQVQQGQDERGIRRRPCAAQDRRRTKIAAWNGERDTAFGAARKAIVDGELKGALATAKATKTGLAMLPKILGDRIELKFENGEPVRRIMAADGKTP
jgi:hypothetical protein